MSFTPALDRRLARQLARLGVVGSTVMLVTTLLGLSTVGMGTAGAAGTLAGPATIVHPADGSSDAGDPLTSGTSATKFSLALPAGASCPGDSANDGFNVTSFMVRSSVDVASLQFNPVEGPNPVAVGASFSQPLWEAETGNAFVGIQTANADTPGGPGRIVNIATFDFGTVFAPGNIPAGGYTLGIACIKGPPDSDQLSRFWTASITVATSTTAAGGPAAITWTAAAPGTTTTTSGTGATTTTTAGGSTTTTAGGGTTTTTAGSGSTTSTTTSGSSSTTSTTACVAATTSTTSASTSTTGASSTTSTTSSTSTSSTLPTCATTSTTSASGASGGPSANAPGTGALPLTGASPTEAVMWAFLLLVCGRMAVVLSRPPKVPASDR